MELGDRQGAGSDQWNSMNVTEADNTRAWNCQLVFICGLILINFYDFR